MNVPKLRFKEFNDEWKKEKFKDFSYYSGKRNRNNLPLIAYSITNTNGFVPQTEAHNEFGYMKNTDRTAYNIVTSNSFAYNPARINVGSIGYYSGKEDIIVSSLYEVFKLKNYINDKFIWYWLKSEKLPYWINKLQEGSVRQYFYYDKLCETFLYHPSLQEQIKISNTLELLDKKIELQAQKIEVLKLFKLGISNTFFNKNVNVKKSTLNNFCKLFTAKSKVNVIDSNGCYYVMDMGTITSDGYLLHNKPTFCKDDMLKKGDLIMPKDDIGGGLIIGKTGYINKNQKYILGDHVYLIKTENINPLFLHYQINSKYINNELKKKVTGSAQLGLKASNITNQKIFIYSEQMQNKISNILRLYDKKIILEFEKTEKIQALKKGLLQKMFF